MHFTIDLTHVLVSLVSGMAIVIGWYTSRTLAKIDDNQKVLFDRCKDMGERLSKLEGEHTQAFKMGGHP